MKVPLLDLKPQLGAALLRVAESGCKLGTLPADDH
jgi:hypothetical protein